MDWDSDGRVDLLLGCGDGSVLFYKNIGTAKEPKLAQSQTLVAAGKAAGAKIAPGMRAKICAVDWNGDGRLDLLVGDFCMYEAKIDVPENQRKAVAKAREQQKEIEKKLNELRKTYRAALDGPSKKETPAEIAVRKKKLREIAEQYEDFEPNFERALARLAKLSRLAKAGVEEKKEIVILRRELNAIEKKYVEIMEALLPYETAPFDEPAEKSKARREKMRGYNTQLFPLRVEAALLAEITRPYDSNQMAGSVWLYLRQDATTPKAQRRR
ncbi:MAG: VCBS repeat-containing protein [Planctomycetes bacterium]|nr:VCBS repeat-containing protein [Planctomycetota bacterium]